MHKEAHMQGAVLGGRAVIFGNCVNPNNKSFGMEKTSLQNMRKNFLLTAPDPNSHSPVQDIRPAGLHSKA